MLLSAETKASQIKAAPSLRAQVEGNSEFEGDLYCNRPAKKAFSSSAMFRRFLGGAKKPAPQELPEPPPPPQESAPDASTPPPPPPAQDESRPRKSLTENQYAEQ